MMGALGAHGTEEQACKATVSARADHEHVGAGGLVDENFCGLPLPNGRLSLDSGVGGALDRGVCGLPRKFLERLSTDGGHVAGSLHGQWDVPRGDEP